MPRRKPDVPKIATLEFLSALFPRPVEPAQLLLRSRTVEGRVWESHWTRGPDEATRAGVPKRRRRDVFFTATPQLRDLAYAIARERRPRVSKTHFRGTEASATVMTMLWAVIGVAAPGRAAGGPGHLPPTLKAALELLAEAISIPPSIVVGCGDAVQVYWPLDEPFALDTGADRARARGLLMKIHTTLDAAALARGLRLDATPSLAQELRLPCTTNHQVAGKPGVHVVHFPLDPDAADARYRLEDFDALPEPEAAEHPLLRPRLSSVVDPGPYDLGPVLGGCAFLRHCWDERSHLPGDELEVAARILGRCAVPGAGGPALLHRLCEEHPGNLPSAVDDLYHAALRAEPASCDVIGATGKAYALYCRSCPHFARRESPLTLARVTSTEAPDLGTRSEADDEAAAEPSAEAPAEAPAEPPAEAEDGRPQVMITPREDAVLAEVLANVVERQDGLYHYQGRLVRVHRLPGGGAGRPVILVQKVGAAQMREIVTRCCQLVRPGPSGEPRPVHPPQWMISALLGLGVWPGVSELEGVLDAPDGLVVWAGLPAPARSCGRAGRDVERAARPEDGPLIRGLAEVLDALGGEAASSQVLAALAAEPGAGRFATLRRALAERFDGLENGRPPTASQLSAVLGALHGRRVDGWSIERGPRSDRGVRWQVRRHLGNVA